MKNKNNEIQNTMICSQQTTNRNVSRQRTTTAKQYQPKGDVQALRRNTPKGQPGYSPRTLPRKKRGNATTESSQQVGQVDTMNSQYRGHTCSARLSNREVTERRIYDPLLGRHSIPVVNVPNLLELIVDDANFLKAVKKINSEPYKAVGCDHKTVREVCQPLIADAAEREKVRSLILKGFYLPSMVRTVLIPKANGKMRSLGIATVMDRIVQTMILQAVTLHLPENPWSPYSFAYQPKRGVADAIAEANLIREEGYKLGITLDLKAFFDNVPHDRLIAKLNAHITDKRVVKLVIRFITPIVKGIGGKLIRNRIGTPQGSIISPWLSSILYMDELDKELIQRGLRYVRYADDVTVFCQSKQAAKRVKARLIEFIEHTMKCPVNRDKTQIVEIKHISMLGVELKHGKWRIQRKKQLQARAAFCSELNRFGKTGNVQYLIKAAQQMNGFVEHYKRIPGLAKNEVPSLRRWSKRLWKAALRKQHVDQNIQWLLW